MNPFSLTNKTVFITGASAGIGRAIAIECSKMGATVIITGRNKERLNETFHQLKGANHAQFIADLQIDEQINYLTDKLPLIDGVVHSAGIVTTLPFQFITKDKLNEILAVNFISPTLISQQLLEKKKINKGASFVWISSISGTICSFAGNSMYSSTKGAVNGIVKGMAVDLARKGIRVNSINPGQIETNILDRGIILEEQIMEEVKKYPLRRFGRPEEIAYAAIYLLSDASAWTTGSHLLIDGGYTLI